MNNHLVPIIQNRIYEVRGHKVMLDFDLANLYEVETRRLNEQVKRNINKFPEDFMFRLTADEWELLSSKYAVNEGNNNSSQFATSSKKHRGKVYSPYAFTEHGVTMLASVLRSKKAIAMNIAIVRAFIAVRHVTYNHKDLHSQLNELRTEMQTRIGEHDTQLAAIYDALENLLDKKQAEFEAKENWKKRQRIGFKK
jgi:phage regulator Rha-like protein